MARRGSLYQQIYGGSRGTSYSYYDEEEKKKYKHGSLYQQTYGMKTIDFDILSGYRKVAEVGGFGEFAKEEKPKAGTLQRIISLLSSFETAPALMKVVKAKKEGKFKFFPWEYAKSVYSGLKTTIAGVPEEKIEQTTYKDILTELGVESDLGKLGLGKIGYISGKGAIGLALDIALDPITYITVGVGKGVQIGGKTLTKPGMKATQEVAEKLAKKGVEKAAKKGIAQNVDEVYKVIMKKAAKPGSFANKNFGYIIDRFADKGGIKFAGQTVVSGNTLKKISKPVTQLIDSVPILKNIREGIGKTFWRDYGLTDDQIQVFQKNIDLRAANTADNLQKALKIAEKYNIDQTASENIGRALHQLDDYGKKDLFEKLKPNEKKVFNLIREAYKKDAKIGLKYGLLKKNEIRKNYAARFYKNSPEEVKRIKDAYQIKFAPNIKGRQKGRIFKTLEEAEKAGLTPDYNAIENLVKRQDITNHGVMRNRIVSEIKDKFSEPITKLGKKVKVPKPVKGLKNVMDIKPISKSTKDSILVEITRRITPAGYTEKSEIPIRLGKKIYQTTITGNVEDISKYIGKYKTTKYKGTWQINTPLTSYAPKPTDYVVYKAKGLKDVYIPKPIAERLNKMSQYKLNDESTQALLRGYDKVLNLYKGSLTSLFPSFHGRNTISNIAQNMLDMGIYHSLNPKNTQETLDLMSLYNGKHWLTGSELTQTQIKRMGAQTIDTPLGKMTMLEIMDAAKKKGIFGGFYQKEIGETFEKELGRKFATKAKKVAEAPFTYGRKFGGFIEDQARLMNFVGNVKQGLSFDKAAKHTKEFLFDYGNLSDFEKTYMRRLIPFYTWFRKNIELQLKQMAKQPGKYASFFKTIREGMAEEDRSKLPKWMQSKLAIRAGETEDGIPKYWSNLGLPIEAFAEDVKQISGLVTGKDMSMLSRITPVLKYPLEKVTGKDFFRGEDIQDIYTDASLAMISKIPGMKNLLQIREVEKETKEGKKYTEWVANPSRLHLLRSFPTSRMQSVVGQVQREGLDPLEKALQQATGIRPYIVDMEKVESKRVAIKRKKLEDLLVRYGIGARSKSGAFFIPQKKKKELEKILGKQQAKVIINEIYRRK